MAEEARQVGSRGNLSVAYGEDNVRGFFDGIFARYDLMNTLMSAGRHYRWRRKAIRLAAPPAGGKALDICCGTGDFSFALRRYMGREAGIIGLDFSDGMLSVARAKSSRKRAGVTFMQGNAMALPFKDGTFDITVNGFGMRNVVDISAGLDEMRRVLKPSGKAVVLEIVNPQKGFLRPFFRLWFDRIVPILGKLGGRAGEAYAYLPASVKRYPEPAEFSRMLAERGLVLEHLLILGGGMIALHIAVKPE